MAEQKNDKVLLFCIDNDFETRYVTAEFREQNLIVRFTHFAYTKEKCNQDFIYVFDETEIKSLSKDLNTNKSGLLDTLKEKFNTFSACYDILSFAKQHDISYETIENYSYQAAESRYMFGDICETSDRLYDEQGNLIVPTLYTHPQNGIMKIYTYSGNLLLEIPYKNKKMNGEIKWYYKDTDAIIKILNYKDDVADGITKSFYKDGKLRFISHFKNGMLKRICEYNKEGTLICDMEYENFERNGKTIYYHNNGQIETELTYKNDNLDGCCKSYYDTGEIEEEAYFENGKANGLFLQYYKDGKIRRKMNFKNDKEYGIEEVYYESGAIKQTTPYVNGKIDGTSYFYYENKKIEAEFIYKRGKKEGIQKTYHYSGKIRSITEYKNDKINGVDRHYYNNGNVSFEHRYKNGKRDGYSISYNEKNGEIEYKIFFRNGEVVDFYGNEGITGVKGLPLVIKDEQEEKTA